MSEHTTSYETHDKEPPEAWSRKAGSTVFNGLILEKERANDLPVDFAEAQRIQGHSIEAFLDQYEDVDSINTSSWREKTPSDQEFMQRDHLLAHAKAVDKFTNALSSGFPEKLKGQAYSHQDAWTQHNSRQFIKEKFVDKKTDKPTSRVYLNPEYEDCLEIYAKIFARAEKAQLRFKAKVFDLKKNQDQDRMAKYWEDSKNIKIDPIVIYGYEDSQDALLGIAKEVYGEHEKSFHNRTIGSIPMRIADGFAIGTEPIGLGGEESLTSHRENILEAVVHELEVTNPRWNEATSTMRKRAVSKSFRNRAARYNIDPDNIAFDKIT